MRVSESNNWQAKITDSLLVLSQRSAEKMGGGGGGTKGLRDLQNLNGKFKNGLFSHYLLVKGGMSLHLEQFEIP